MNTNYHPTNTNKRATNANKRLTGTGCNIHLFPLLMILPGLIACFACAGVSQNYWGFFGLLIIIAFSSMLPGGLMGFLFGIPKLNRKYNPREDYGTSTKYMPNTNLEDVSDWLTKIIIGVTLTQLGKIPGYLQNMADSVIENSSSLMLQVDFAKPLLIALIIYSFIAGFIISYFYTRIYLPNLFAVMEENSIRGAEINLWREGMREKGISYAGERNAKELIASLSKEERELLRNIGSAGNRLQIRLVTDIYGQAAVRLLLAKGIIQTGKGDSPGEGDFLTIADKELLLALNELTG